MSYRILVADDQTESLRAIVELLQRGRTHWVVEEAQNGTDALERLLEAEFDLSLLDMHMPGLTGLDIVEHLHRMGHPVPSVLMTASPTRQIEMAAMELGVLTMLRKPISPDVLRLTIQRILKNRRPR